MAGTDDQRGGSVPLRPLGLVELLDGAVRLVRRNPGASFLISLPFAVVRAVALGAVALASRGSDNTQVLQLMALLAVDALVGTMRTGVLAPVYSSDLVGARVGAGAALRRAAPSLLPLTGMALVLMLAQSAGALALGVAGVWLWGVWAVAAPALVIERTGPIRALGRSVALVRGAYWRTWGIRALGSIVTYLLGELFVVPFQVLGYGLGGDNPFDPSDNGAAVPLVVIAMATIGSLLAAAVVGPISSAIDVLLYADGRMRAEGMDLVMALPPIDAAPPQPQPAAPVTAW